MMMLKMPMNSSTKRPAVIAAAIVLLGTIVATPARATFSIVAVDPVTGEVGCAGASCVNNVSIIGDPIEGIGAINTQAFYLAGNQQNARARMLAGDSPQEIADWLAANDYSGNSSIRQYGIVDLNMRSAAFTGTSTMDWKGHRTGRGYAIQGNILLNQTVVMRMENAFLASEGKPLADRLMETLEAAAFSGADRRCAPLSSTSAFIQVARIGDGANLYLKLLTRSSREEPIQLLRRQYDQWRAVQEMSVDPYRSHVSVRPPVRLADGRAFGYLVVVPRNVDHKRLSLAGITPTITAMQTGASQVGSFIEVKSGVYAAEIVAPTEAGLDTFTVLVDDGLGRGPIELAASVTARFIAPAAPEGN